MRSGGHLLVVLNEKRLNDLSHHHRLFSLETALRELNGGKGLGFLVMCVTSQKAVLWEALSTNLVRVTRVHVGARS